MDVAFVVYDGMTALDFVGAYDPITRLSTMGYRSLEWDVVGRGGAATANAGMRVETDRVAPDLGEYDMVVVPGGFATDGLVDNGRFVDWIRGAGACELKVSVCTGSLLLGAAGFLEGRRATTHPSAYDRLAEYCEVVRDRVVDDGDVITGRGVSSSIDLGLHVVERLSDAGVRAGIAEQMDYPYGDG